MKAKCATKASSSSPFFFFFTLLELFEQQPRPFWPVVIQQGNSGNNEEIFSLVTLIYPNLDKKCKVFKFKEFISLNNTATLTKPQTANRLWLSDKSCPSPLACLIKAANPTRSMVLVKLSDGKRKEAKGKHSLYMKIKKL